MTLNLALTWLLVFSGFVGLALAAVIVHYDLKSQETQDNE